jgi:hypothetical protein
MIEPYPSYEYFSWLVNSEVKKIIRRKASLSKESMQCGYSGCEEWGIMNI